MKERHPAILLVFPCYIKSVKIQAGHESPTGSDRAEIIGERRAAGRSGQPKSGNWSRKSVAVSRVFHGTGIKRNPQPAAMAVGCARVDPPWFMSAGVLIQWENNEVGLPSPSLSPTGPDGLGWQIRQRIWSERLSNCLARGLEREWRRLVEGWEPKARRNKGLPRRDYTKGIHIANVRVTDWIALPSCPRLQHCFSHSVFSRKLSRAPLSASKRRADRHTSPVKSVGAVSYECKR